MTKLRRDILSEDDYTPLDAGWDARLEHKRLWDNPYAINNWKHYEWEQGWVTADESEKNADAN